MNAIVPIARKSDYDEIVKISDSVRQKVTKSDSNEYQPASATISASDAANFARLSGKWTCRVRRANVRFEQLDWHNTLLADHCTLGQLTLAFVVMEDAFYCALINVESNAALNLSTTISFRIDDHPIKSLQAYTDGSHRNVVISWDEAKTLARYMTGGRRLAIELPGRFTAVFNTTGFEFANFDPLRRFVFV